MQQEHEARDDCAQRAMEEGIQIQVEFSEVAWASGLGAEEIQDVHLCEWLLLAWTQCGDAKSE